MTCPGSQLAEALLTFTPGPCASWERDPYLAAWGLGPSAVSAEMSSSFSLGFGGAGLGLFSLYSKLPFVKGPWVPGFVSHALIIGMHTH